jgi:hypothetical protein
MALSQAPARTANRSATSRTEATPATVAAYLDDGKHTQAEAARFFQVSERTIRNRLTEHRQIEAAAPLATAPGSRTRTLRRISRPHHSYTRPAAPAIARSMDHKRFLPIAPHLVAGLYTNWCAWDGELRPVVPGTIGAQWNQEQKRLQQAAASRKHSAIVESEAATTVPLVPLGAAVEREDPDVAASRAALLPVAAQHNAIPQIARAILDPFPNPDPLPGPVPPPIPNPMPDPLPPEPIPPIVERGISLRDDYARRRMLPSPKQTGVMLARLVDLAMLMIGPVPLIAWVIVAAVVLYLVAR